MVVNGGSDVPVAIGMGSASVEMATEESTLNLPSVVVNGGSDVPVATGMGSASVGMATEESALLALTETMAQIGSR